MIKGVQLKGVIYGNWRFAMYIVYPIVSFTESKTTLPSK